MFVWLSAAAYYSKCQRAGWPLPVFVITDLYHLSEECECRETPLCSIEDVSTVVYFLFKFQTTQTKNTALRWAIVHAVSHGVSADQRATIFLNSIHCVACLLELGRWTNIPPPPGFFLSASDWTAAQAAPHVQALSVISALCSFKWELLLLGCVKREETSDLPVWQRSWVLAGTRCVEW